MTAVQPSLPFDTIGVIDAVAPVELLGDDGARHTVRADLDRSLFVEAGAGTGKTTVLVSRVVELVGSGRLTDIGHLAAITFTEAAAAELRDRIRTALEHAAAIDPDGARRHRFAEAVARIDDAVITTIHGFAHRLLAEHPLEAGLPPVFEVDEGVHASLAFEQRWTRFCDDLFADPSAEPLLVHAITLGLKVGQLRTIAAALHARWDRLVDAPLAGAAVPPVDLVPLRSALDRLADVVEPFLDRTDDWLVHKALGALALRELLELVVEPLDELRALANADISAPGRSGKGELWGAAKQPASEAMAEVHAIVNTTLKEQRAAVLEALLPRLAAFTLTNAAERRRHGRVEFHDLLVLARDLVRDDTAVRVAASERVDVLLIDEFQDTDPLQLDLAVLLCGRDPAAPPPKSLAEADLAPGKLLLVGDPKQSIYRFRGADIALWDRALAHFEDGRVQLTTNFRSVPPILEWVNAVFDRVLVAGDEGEQPAYVPLAAARASLDDQPAVVVVGGPSEERVGAIRDRESAELAALITTMRAQRWPVHDGDDTRPVQAADIAILVPTRTPLTHIESALDAADIPYRVESRSLVWATEAVRDVLSILSAIDDPGDEIAVVAALRSPGFACSDDDLVDYALAGGRWDYRGATPDGLPDEHPVLEARRSLCVYHDARMFTPVHALVERVIRERRLPELTMAERRPRDHGRRLRFVLDQARAFVDAGGRSLGEFIAWARLQADENAQVVETVVPEPDDDAVRILTVHGAKGLEFPVVVLAGLNNPGDTGSPVVLWGDSRPEVVAGPKSGARFETAGYADAAAASARADSLESQRLLYVAATRARDHLVVSVHHPIRRASHAARLFAVCTELEGRWRPPPPPVPLFAPPPVTDQPAMTVDERTSWLAAHATLAGTTGRRHAMAATAIGTEAARDESPAYESTVDQHEAQRPAPWRRGGTAVGRAVHGVLQDAPFAPGEPIDVGALASLAAVHAAAEGVPDAELDVARLAASALASPAVAEARASGRFWREVPVAAAVAGNVVEGTIDLLYETAAGQLVVVDYKTDRGRSEAELDARAEHYRLQAGAYALAVDAALGRPVSRCVFVFCRVDGPAYERDVDDAAVAAADAAAVLALG